MFQEKSSTGFLKGNNSLAIDKTKLKDGCGRGCCFGDGGGGSL